MSIAGMVLQRWARKKGKPAPFMGRSSRAAAASICINNTGILQQPKKIIKDQNLDQTSYFYSSSREGKNQFCIRVEEI
jgi:hypothetical protein